MINSDDYVEVDGTECPVCSSTDLRVGQLKVSGKNVKHHITCIDCYSTWWDVYTLSGYVDLVDRSTDEEEGEL